MRNGLALLTLTFGWALLATASCGSDEGTKSTGHVANCKQCSHSSDCAGGNECRVVLGKFAVCAASGMEMCCDGPDCYTLGGKVEGAGGSGGSAGGGILSGGTGGKGSSGGSGGTGASPSSSNLGRACLRDSDCADPALICLTNDAISGGGPAKGLCTAECTSTNDCRAIADNSYCYQLTDAAQKYCIEGCSEGTFGVPKCHERTEVACNLIGLLPQGTACQSSNDCAADELCDNSGECGQFVTGCTPLCGGDYDCGKGQYCDFATGLCTSTKPTGLPIGASCTPPVGSEPDPCNGICLAGPDDPTAGECSAFCTSTDGFTGCGWDGTGTPDAACLFGTILSGGDLASGDLGLCGKFCDCNDDCTAPGEYCADETGGQILQVFGHQGYCRALQPTESVAKDTFRQCPAGGGNGGAGGEPGTGGTSAQAGAGGQGGA